MNGQSFNLHPDFLHIHFHGDIDALEDFIENLPDEECSIITSRGMDIDYLHNLKRKIDDDVSNSAKALAIEG